MPIYEYHCSACESGFEKLVKVRAPTPPCPECNSTDNVEKQVSASGFILKGGGWYKDHYGLKSTGSDSKSSDSGSSSSESAGSKAKAISKAAADAGE